MSKNRRNRSGRGLAAPDAHLGLAAPPPVTKPVPAVPAAPIASAESCPASASASTSASASSAYDATSAPPGHAGLAGSAALPARERDASSAALEPTIATTTIETSSLGAATASPVANDSAVIAAKTEIQCIVADFACNSELVKRKGEFLDDTCHTNVQ